ncbi:hypothetical protein B0H12DRAFT_1158721 [Mycena haematopus]|nr:hypothetical protein B0H12DRAFT_1158721 [Mycena haematopus]
MALYPLYVCCCLCGRRSGRLVSLSCSNPGRLSPCCISVSPFGLRLPIDSHRIASSPHPIAAFASSLLPFHFSSLQLLLIVPDLPCLPCCTLHTSVYCTLLYTYSPPKPQLERYIDSDRVRILYSNWYRSARTIFYS